MIKDHIESMKVLLGSSIPTRNQINNITLPVFSKSYKFNVIRTMPFEYISRLVPYFQVLNEEKIEFEISGYDSSLSQITVNDADGYILWIDWRIYQKSMTAEAVVEWLMDRLTLIRSQTKKAIAVNNWPENMEYGEILFSSSSSVRAWASSFNYLLANKITHLTGCSVIDLNWLSNSQSFEFFDKRNDQITHYPFSDKATMTIARHLSLQLIPAILKPRLKAIVLDLDGTLYKGVLAEDGVNKLKLTEGHEKLQHILKRLKNSGLLLALCSRNVEEDVKSLFDFREDFPLKWEDFSLIEVNWLNKSENILNLTQKLNIDTADVLFLDDNIVELAEVKYEIPNINIMQADEDGNETSSYLSNFPRMYQINLDETGHLRNEDIKANQTRLILKNKARDQVSYLTGLQTKIQLFQNLKLHTRRVSELSNKTNQFNLNFKRFAEAEVEELMSNDSTVILTVELSDILSESGIIGVFICKTFNENARLIETIFSCRALGRNIETIAFHNLLLRLKKMNIQTITIDYTQGPRNAPALEWLNKFIGQQLNNIDLIGLIEHTSKFCNEYPIEVMGENL